jgi:hypothetical protein
MRRRGVNSRRGAREGGAHHGRQWWRCPLQNPVQMGGSMVTGIRQEVIGGGGHGGALGGDWRVMGAGRKSEAGRQLALLNRCRRSEREGEGGSTRVAPCGGERGGSSMGAAPGRGGDGGVRAARAWSRGERGREAGQWAAQWGGAQLAVGREAMIGGPGPGKMKKKKRKHKSNRI